ncbi:MAG TPA: LON peptidase substrate-binding domain-containing protein [Armatimonadota bacterium]|nr:LON peptidase substrate-binding domain-containing protein [Armatimonadota bacterium]
MATRRIPIFPLHTVLFPGMRLPLHVFEPRYQEMVRYCREEDRQFGVSLIRSGAEVGGPAEPHAIGTTCEILSATPVGEGRLYLSTVGREPFRIVRLIRERAYLEAEVEILPPPTPGELGDLPGRVSTAASRYIRGLLVQHGQPDSSFELPADPRELSELVGAVLQSPLSVRQELLEIQEVSARLRRELEVLTAELKNANEPPGGRAEAARPFQPRRETMNPN